jgi:hypothetical protein
VEHSGYISGEEDWIPRYRNHFDLAGSRHPSTSERIGSRAVIDAAGTAAAKSACRDPMKFRDAMFRQRGFTSGGGHRSTTNQAFCFEVNDGELFAGLWDRWRDPSGQWIWVDSA